MTSSNTKCHHQRYHRLLVYYFKGALSQHTPPTNIWEYSGIGTSEGGVLHTSLVLWEFFFLCAEFGVSMSDPCWQLMGPLLLA